MDTATEIKKIKDLVHEILAEDLRARNCDKYLTFRVMQRILKGEKRKNLLTVSLNDLKKLPAFETVTRVRARIQNKDFEFLPSDAAVRKCRRIREDVFKTWSTGTPEFPSM